MIAPTRDPLDSCIPLPLALWLAKDDYHKNREEAPPGELLSATGLMRPIRQQVLAKQYEGKTASPFTSLSRRIPSRIGTAIHDAIEAAWLSGSYKEIMQGLGYSPKTIEALVINPETPSEDNRFDVYTEKRAYKPFKSVVITGEADFCLGGTYTDFKFTSVHNYMDTYGLKSEDYILQGSIYRWLMPEIITKDIMNIGFIFNDWDKKATTPGYPPNKVCYKSYQLMTVEATERWIENRVQKYLSNLPLSQDMMVKCSNKERWKKDDIWQYFSNPNNKRSSKNFNTSAAASRHLASKGVGRVAYKAGKSIGCGYCPVNTVCKQFAALQE